MRKAGRKERDDVKGILNLSREKIAKMSVRQMSLENVPVCITFLITVKPIIPIQFPKEQHDSIKEAARELEMSQQDVIRQTVKMYLPDFVERMSPKPKLLKRVSGWEALRGGRGIKLNIKPMAGLVKKIDL